MTQAQYKPQLFDASKAADRDAIEALRVKHPDLRFVDTLADQITELREVDHPDTLGQESPIPEIDDTVGWWAYYPWRATVVRILPEADYARLRSARNQLLITAADQTKFAAARVAVAGLNVGNPAALCLALESGANQMKFADFDTLSVSNLNRFRAGVTDLGLNKAILSARQVTEINPYAQVEVWDEGIKSGQEAKFLADTDVLVEEMDNLPLKLSIRQAAREMRMPVVMVTGNGPNVVIDIERYDLDPEAPILNGYLRPEVIDAIEHPRPGRTLQDRVLMARDFMDQRYLTPELNASFPEVGRTLAGIPQLAESSFLRGAAVCYMVRLIVTGAPAPSGRYSLNLDKVFPSEY